MRQDWIYHHSHEEFFRNPFGAVACGSQVTLRLEVNSKVQPEQVLIRLWLKENHEDKVSMYLRETEGERRIYEAQISVPRDPGLVWYYFEVKIAGEVWYYGNNSRNSGGRGRVTNSSPTSYQITVFHRDTKTPAWFKEAVMYQIFVDRFANGCEDGRVLNPKKGSLIHAGWDETPIYIRDVRQGKVIRWDFFGGNLLGVLKKLPYLKELGVSVLYLNPIFEAPSNHKYDTADYKNIDTMFGDNEIFVGLCEIAESMGISVILDGVFSHTGSDSIYFNKEGTYPELGAYQSVNSPYHSWYRFSRFPEEYESWWGIETLPNVNEMEPSYQDFIIHQEDSVVKFWMKQGATGWRLDVVDEIPGEFVKMIRQAMKRVKPDSVLIGEVWEDASNKVSYGERREYLLGAELDSVMNYPFRATLLDFMLGHKAGEECHEVLMSLKENYPLEHFYSTMNLIGSHDIRRILTLLGEAPHGDTLTIEQMVNYKLDPNQRKLAINRLKLLTLIQFTFPGVPCIYYGDEVGMEGHGDPFCRGPFPWGRENKELLDWHKKLIALRNREDVLKTGSWEPLLAQGDVYGYLRLISGGQDVFGGSKKDNVALIIVNRNTTKDVTVELDLSRWNPGSKLVEVLATGAEDNGTRANKDGLNGKEQREISVVQGKLSIKLTPLEGKLYLQAKDVQPAGALPALLNKRASGVLLHPTSLPSRYGIGDLGPGAFAFVDFLRAGGQKFWQILPLNPAGFGESPYQSFSAFAGNQLLISPEKLVDQGLLTSGEVAEAPQFSKRRIEFERVREFKDRLLRLAYDRFKAGNAGEAYRVFVQENSLWLENYSLFMALKSHFNGAAWNNWPREIAFREEQALADYRSRLADEVNYHRFLQYVFFSQWQELKDYANQHRVEIIGDLPIFISYDSSDTWANPQLFQLDAKGNPAKVAGVPPDYFSETGQLWGNPHYNWEEMAKDDYRWWRERLAQLFKLTDFVRIDHFRGFEAYWEVPGDEKTAVNGRWVKGPGEKFFATIKSYLGEMPLIAEDLGIITPEVDRLKDSFGFPGMKVLHFMFETGVKEIFLSLFQENVVLYTGTHDNDTTLGWFKKSLKTRPEISKLAEKYFQIEPDLADQEKCWRLIKIVLDSRANTVIFPLQDILTLDTEARMNYPGTVGGNWDWRVGREALTGELAAKINKLTHQAGRL